MEAVKSATAAAVRKYSKCTPAVPMDSLDKMNCLLDKTLERLTHSHSYLTLASKLQIHATLEELSRQKICKNGNKAPGRTKEKSNAF